MNGLELGEADQSPPATLDSDTAPLQPAERLARYARLVGVHPHGPGVDVPGNIGSPAGVVRPDRRAQAEVGVIGSRYCVIEVVVADDWEGRPELLLVDQPGAVGKANDECGLEEIAGPVSFVFRQ